MFQNCFMNGLSTLPLISNGRSRAINAENPHGEKGKGGMAASHLGPSRKGSPCIKGIAPGSTVTLAEMEGPGVIQHIWITVIDKTDAGPFVLRDLVLRMYWDDETVPSVESPLGDFFCNGFARGYVVNSMPIVVNPARGFNCYFPMPFRKKAKITIENQHDAEVPAFFYQVDYCLYDELPKEIAYFHAQWKRQRITNKAEDYVILDGVKGKGHYIGTFMALTTLERYWWGEGEIKFYIDGDDEYPTICGTGTEDYFNTAWCPQQEQCTPYHGIILGGGPNWSGKISTYRYHILDPIIFEKSIKVTIEHGHNNNRCDDISSTAYWYQTEPHKEFEPISPLKDRLPLPDILPFNEEIMKKMFEHSNP